jgi:hypothetical protein
LAKASSEIVRKENREPYVRGIDDDRTAIVAAAKSSLRERVPLKQIVPTNHRTAIGEERSAMNPL